MSSFGRKKTAARIISGERRRIDRDRVTLTGTLNTSAVSRSARLIDVSPSGAQVSGRDLPKVGKFVRLRLKDFAVFATVAWREEDKCGLHFDETLSEELMQNLWQADEQSEGLDMETCPLEMWKTLRNEN